MTVSIIIKALNEEHRIAATIESALRALAIIGAQDSGEIILADSGSKDRTVAIASLYPVMIVQIEAPAKPGCGVGPQLGFQYSTQPYICLMDGDILLDEQFLGKGLEFLASHPEMAGVTGHVIEQNNDNLEYARREQRDVSERKSGEVDRINCGGLYRRAAIEQAGYCSDRNLHSYEEYDLGIRLRSQGWKLFRLDIPYAAHFGHSVNAYHLLIRRWKTKYIRGIGELVRGAIRTPYFLQIFKELPELRLWVMVYGWLFVMLLLLLFLPNKLLALSIDVGLVAAALLLMSAKYRSLRLGIYAVTAWFFHAAAMPLGFFAKRRDPRERIESKILHQGKLRD